MQNIRNFEWSFSIFINIHIGDNVYYHQAKNKYYEYCLTIKELTIPTESFYDEKRFIRQFEP